MKFMITWQFHQGKLHEGYSQFFKMTPEQDAADRGSRIKQIGRWHDLARGRGVVICESESAEAVANWALNWNSLLDADVQTLSPSWMTTRRARWARVVRRVLRRLIERIGADESDVDEMSALFDYISRYANP